MDNLAKHPRDSATFEAIDIFMFTNGQQYSPPRKYHLNVDELNRWEITLASLARSQYGALHSKIEVYTINGVKITSPMELVSGGAYVAVNPPDTFTDTGYHKYLIKASRSWEKRQQRRSELLGLSGSDNAHSSKIYEEEINNDYCDNLTCIAKKIQIPCKKPYKCTNALECRKSPVINRNSNVTRPQPNNTKIPLVAKRSPIRRKINITKTETRNRTNNVSPYKTVTAHILKYGRNVPKISGSIKIKSELPLRSVSPVNTDNKKEVSNNTTTELENNMIREEKPLIIQELKVSNNTTTELENNMIREEKPLMIQQLTNIPSNNINTNSILKTGYEKGEKKYEFVNEIKSDVYNSKENVTDTVHPKSEILINKSPTKKQSIEASPESKVKLENNTTCNIYNESNSDDQNSDKYEINLQNKEIPITSENNLTSQTTNKITKQDNTDENKPISCDDVCYLQGNQKEDKCKQSTYSVYTNPNEEKKSTVFVCEERNLVNGKHSGIIEIVFETDETDESANIPTKDELGNDKYNGEETYYIKEYIDVATNYETIPNEKQQSKTKLFQNNESQTSQKIITKDSFDKFSTLINKGDVLNLKLTIEVRNDTKSNNVSGHMKLEKESQAELNMDKNYLNNTSDVANRNTFLLDTIDSSQLNEKYSKLIIVQCTCSHNNEVNNLFSLNNGQNRKGNNKKILLFPGDVTQDIRCKCGIISPTEKVNKHKHTDYSEKKNNTNSTKQFLKTANVIRPPISAKRKESLRVQEMVATLEKNMKPRTTDLHDPKKKRSASIIGYDENGQFECEMNKDVSIPCTEWNVHGDHGKRTSLSLSVFWLCLCVKRISNTEEKIGDSPTLLMKTVSLSSIEMLSNFDPDKTEEMKSVKRESTDEKQFRQKNEKVKTLESICRHGLYTKTKLLSPEADSNTNDRFIGKRLINDKTEKKYKNVEKSDVVANAGISECKECEECSELKLNLGFTDATTQTDWRESILEARVQKDGHYSLHYPSLQTLRLYNL